MIKKLVATILIIATILSLNLNIFLLKPPKAQAFLGIGDITIDIVNQVKDWILDQLPKTVARHMMVRLQQEIARWAQGGFSDENKPFAMTSWKQEIQEALNVASGRFVQDFNLTPLCAPIRVGLNAMLGLGLSPYGRVPYTEYAACTLGDIVDNVEEFWKNPSISIYGWDTWTALAQPQNNIYGSFLLAAARQAELESEEIAEKEKEIEAGQGYKSEAICTEDDQQACAKSCSRYPAFTSIGTPNPDYVACMSACEKSSIGVCLKKQTTKLGSEIKTSLDKMIGSDIDWLITADEITEMLNLVFSGLFTKLIHGTGLSVKPFYQAQTTVSKYQLEYGYQQQYKKAQTPESLKKLRTDILNNILQAIKRVTTSSYECDKDYQLKGEVFQEVAAEILDQESQHLYTGVEGVDLKPDFEVLDGPSAVANGIAVYGVTWNDIPFSRYPEKCSKIVGKKCSDITINLPYGLELNNINSECTTGCLGRINDYREEKNEEGERKFTDNEAISKAVADGKCSNIAIGRACLDGANLIINTENRCDECLTKAQKECESITNSEEKKYCIEKNCSEYQDISPSIVDAQDFYNRCKAYSLKSNCNVCLKEYFMPASYCEEIYDYVNRSFVKYPAQVYEDLWWGSYYKYDECADNDIRNPDFNFWSLLNPLWARWEAFSWLTANRKGYIPVGLTCRILPDFKFPKGGTCDSFCKATKEELQDITDHKPSDLDCKGEAIHSSWGGVWDASALHPGGQIIPYLARKKAKCCPALTGHEPEMYRKCRGIIGDAVEEEPPNGGEECPNWNPDYKDAAGLSNMSLAWKDLSFNMEILKPEAYTSQAMLLSIRDPYRGATFYVTKPFCDAERVYGDGTRVEFDLNGDGKFDDEFVDDPSFPGHFLGYCKNKITGQFKNPSEVVCEMNLLNYPHPGTEGVKVCPEIGNYSGGLWGTIRYPEGAVGICVPR